MEPDPTPVKRGRGRPRKDKGKDPVGSAPLASSAVVATPDPLTQREDLDFPWHTMGEQIRALCSPLGGSYLARLVTGW